MNRVWNVVAVVLIFMVLCVPASAETPVIRFTTDTSDLDVAFIRNRELVTNLNHPNSRGVIARYAGVDLGETVQKVTCRARFYGGGAVALVSGPIAEWSVSGVTTRSIHLVITSESYHFGFFENGNLTDVLTGLYTLDTSGATEHTFGFSVSGSTITLQLPTGEKVKKRDERVKSCNGTRVVFEHYLTAADVETGTMPAITYISAKGKSKPALEDDFQRSDGVLLESPTGHAYALFRND